MKFLFDSPGEKRYNCTKAQKKEDNMRTTEQRAAKYTSKYDPATISLKVAAQLENMHGFYEAHANEIVPKEIATQEVLNGASPTIPRIQYPFYYAFSREIFHMVRSGIAGDALKAEAVVLGKKWAARGLNKTVLQDIAKEVWNLDITIP
jgi:hypothetical protein